MNSQEANPESVKSKKRIFRLTAYSFLFMLAIPLLTIAIEPSNPSVVCERFLASDLKTKCETKAKADDIDWYAANACNNISDDDKFFKCWDSLKGAQYNPEAMELCARGENTTDEQKMDCFGAMKGRSFTKDELRPCTKSENSTEVKDCLSKAGRMPASSKN